MRGRLQDAMVHLKKKYRAALKDDEMQRAFDEFWSSWPQGRAGGAEK
jgi:hypothetical protein